MVTVRRYLQILHTLSVCVCVWQDTQHWTNKILPLTGDELWEGWYPAFALYRFSYRKNQSIQLVSIWFYNLTVYLNMFPQRYSICVHWCTHIKSEVDTTAMKSTMEVYNWLSAGSKLSSKGLSICQWLSHKHRGTNHSAALLAQQLGSRDRWKFYKVMSPWLWRLQQTLMKTIDETGLTQPTSVKGKTRTLNH